jgi:integrase
MCVTGQVTSRGRRSVPLDDRTVGRLRARQEVQALERVAWGAAWHDSGLVFTREDGQPLRPEYITRYFQRLAAAAGLPVIRLHDLRHTNASIALAAGVDLKVVSDRLGHSTTTPTTITADLCTKRQPQRRQGGRRPHRGRADVRRLDSS